MQPRIKDAMLAAVSSAEGTQSICMSARMSPHHSCRLPDHLKPYYRASPLLSPPPVPRACAPLLSADPKPVRHS